MNANRARALSTAVDSWYAAHARELPWRVSPAARSGGATPDPYLVWLSEVMLQQTTIPHATPYFLRFRKTWPTVKKLAAAKPEVLSEAWAGLGYYARMRNLHACAQAVTAVGGFPQDRKGLLQLPGVGPYTAAAIASIAFGERVAPVDGNIERVVSRLEAIGGDGTEAGWRVAKTAITEAAQALVDALPDTAHAGDLAQGLMDLGATICTPVKPACMICPLAKLCTAYKAGEAERYPVKPAKTKLPVRHGAAFVAINGEDVLLVRRPPSGLLGGMLMPLSTEWTEARIDDAPSRAPGKLDWEYVGEARHVFTHFALKLDVWRAKAPRTYAKAAGGEWLSAEQALKALPTVGKKAVRLALP